MGAQTTTGQDTLSLHELRQILLAMLNSLADTTRQDISTAIQQGSGTLADLPRLSECLITLDTRIHQARTVPLVEVPPLMCSWLSGQRRDGALLDGLLAEIRALTAAPITADWLKAQQEQQELRDRTEPVAEPQHQQGREPDATQLGNEADGLGPRATQAAPFLIFVKSRPAAWPIITLSVHSGDTVQSLRERIQKTGAACSSLLLMFEGKVLRDALALADYNIQNHSELLLVPRMNEAR